MEEKKYTDEEIIDLVRIKNFINYILISLIYIYSYIHI